MNDELRVCESFAFFIKFQLETGNWSFYIDWSQFKTENSIQIGFFLPFITWKAQNALIIVCVACIDINNVIYKSIDLSWSLRTRYGLCFSLAIVSF
jgi:hypothetical protein